MLCDDHRLWADLGERWEVTGHTRMYYGELEIRVSDRDDVRTLDSGDPLPPLPIGTGVMVEPYEGTLVMLDGWAVDVEREGADNTSASLHNPARSDVNVIYC